MKISGHHASHHRGAHAANRKSSHSEKSHGKKSEDQHEHEDKTKQPVNDAIPRGIGKNMDKLPFQNPWKQRIIRPNIQGTQPDNQAPKKPATASTPITNKPKQTQTLPQGQAPATRPKTIPTQPKDIPALQALGAFNQIKQNGGSLLGNPLIGISDFNTLQGLGNLLV